MGIPQFRAKEEQHDGGAYDHTPLKINKDSNFLTRPPPPPPPPSSSTTTSSTTTSDGLTNKSQQQQQQTPPPRRPVIIYTHSPKVIHTHPRDFMALVQKLTGFTPPPEETQQTQDRRHQRRNAEDNESTSVVTEEHGSSVNDIPQVNSCFVDGGVGVTVAPPPYRTAGFDPYYNPTPVFPANPTEFYCGSTHQLPFYNPESLYMNRNCLSSSSSSLRVLKEYPDI